MAVPGILFAFSKPKAPLSEENYNKWYSEHHVVDVINSGLADLAIRYKNTNKDAKWPYVAVYRSPDMAKWQDQSLLASLPKTHELIPDGKSSTDVMDTDLRFFTLLQKFEGQVPKDGPRGKALRSVMMEPAEDGDADFDEWYRKQHLDMLSMVPGYRRTTRYKLVDAMIPLGHPRYLALHEWDDVSYSTEQVKLVTGTEWSKKVIGNAKKFEGDLWDEIAVHGETGTKL